MIRRWLALLLAFTLFQLTSLQHVAIQADEAAVNDVDSPFLGMWNTHFETTFFTIIINPDQTAWIFFIGDKSGHSINEVKWKRVAGGVLVDSIPRFRLWKGPKGKDDFARAQMEELPPGMTGESIKRFPLSFYMKRQNRDELAGGVSVAFAKRALPDGWANETPPEDFDAQVGVPRTQKPR